MPRTPDRSPGVSDEEGIILSDEGVDPSVIGEIRNNGGIVKVMDEVGVIELRAATLLRNVIPTDRTAKDQTTLLFRCPEISDGVELLCEDGGEFLFI